MSTSIPPPIQTSVHRWLEHQCLSPGEWSLQAVQGNGYSVSQIWRLASTTQPERLGFAVRNWGRSNRDRKSIQQILFFQKSLHRGLLKSTTAETSISPGDATQYSSIVPDIMAWPDQSWCHEYASTIWTIETWCPGTSLDRASRVSDSLLDQLLEILVQLHAIGRRLGSQRIIAPGIVERSQRLNEWISIEMDVWNQQFNKRHSSIAAILEWEVLREILRRTLDRLHRHATSIRSHFQRLLSTPVVCHWIIRDLWRENILVEDERISGLIDFGASRIDWPALEIVRMLGSLLEPDDPRIAKYCSQLPSLIGTEDFRFLDHTATLLSLLQWLQWLCFAEISFEGREQRVRSRIIELDQRLSKFPELVNLERMG